MLNLRQSLGAVARNSLRLNKQLYEKNLPWNDAAKLFSEYVELVEVETTSYCNRTCSFCPNVSIDRRSEKHPMPDATWRAIIADLKAVDYRGTVVWSRYSEPLSEPGIIARIRELKSAAPNSRVGINSNGDYLNAALLEELADAGVDRLWIDVYLPDDKPYTTELALEYVNKLCSRAQKSMRFLRRSGNEIWGEMEYGKIYVKVVCRNFESISPEMSDRGGLVSISKREQRSSPCFAPIKHLVIDNDGSVLPCCQLRSDAAQHRHAVVAKIGEQGVGPVAAYVALSDWRKSLSGFGPKKSPCDSCNVSEYSDTALTRTLSGALSGDTLLHRGARTLLAPLIGHRQRF